MSAPMRVQRRRTKGARLPEQQWFWTWDKLPEPGRKIVALYNDGSGAMMMFACDEGYIDVDGDEFGGITESFDRWAYLPDDVEFWCEIRGESPITLPTAPKQSAVAAPRAGETGEA